MTPRIESFGANAIVYSVPVPEHLPKPPEHVKVKAPFVPAIDMRVIVTGTSVSPPVDVVEKIGIAPQWLGTTSAVFITVLALLLCYIAAVRRGVPGTNVFLQIISTRSGYASLSQFQLILWTLVIGVGAVYVMVLSGNLLDITTGALVLLGISGGVTVAAKIQSDQADKQAAAPTSSGLQPPGKIAEVYCDAVSDSEAVLRWVQPSGAPVATYIVEYAVVPETGDPPWSQVAETVQQPRHTVMGLTPGTPYAFRVTASNAAGSGNPSDAIKAQTSAATTPPAGAPAATMGLSTVGQANISSITLAWVAAERASEYIVEQRVHDSGNPWVRALAPRTNSAVLSKLVPATSYDFRVTAQNGTGTGLPSAVLTVSTPRKPLWSDLVVTADGGDTIDVTRLQALLFTMIAAAFVSLQIATGYTIPDIPTGFLTLMGISNGVYIGAKFASTS